MIIPRLSDGGDDIVDFPGNPVPALAPIDPTWQLVCTTASAVGALIAVAYLLREARKQRSWLPVAMIIGTGASLYFEPIFDTNAALIYPHDGLWTMVESFGRRIPWLDGLGYFFYFPLPMWVLMKKFGERAPARFFWRSYAICVLCTLVVELPYLAAHVWRYYGDQPLMIGGYPALLAFWSAPALFGGAFVLHHLRDRLVGRRAALAIPLMPMLIVGFSGAVMYPYTTVLNRPPDQVAYLCGGLAMAGLSVMIMWLIFPRPGNSSASPPTAAAERSRIAG